MLKYVEVKEIEESIKYYNCDVISYIEDGYKKFAAITENLNVKVGDIVEIYTDEYVNYKGFGTMVLRVINE